MAASKSGKNKITDNKETLSHYFFLFFMYEEPTHISTRFSPIEKLKLKKMMEMTLLSMY